MLSEVEAFGEHLDSLQRIGTGTTEEVQRTTGSRAHRQLEDVAAVANYPDRGALSPQSHRRRVIPFRTHRTRGS